MVIGHRGPPCQQLSHLRIFRTPHCPPFYLLDVAVRPPSWNPRRVNEQTNARRDKSTGSTGPFRPGTFSRNTRPGYNKIPTFLHCLGSLIGTLDLLVTRFVRCEFQPRQCDGNIRVARSLYQLRVELLGPAAWKLCWRWAVTIFVTCVASKSC